MAKVSGMRRIGLPVGQMLTCPGADGRRLWRRADFLNRTVILSIACLYFAPETRIRTLWFVLDELDLMWIPVETPKEKILGSRSASSLLHEKKSKYGLLVFASYDALVHNLAVRFAQLFRL
jgi:hypothetical protein